MSQRRTETDYGWVEGMNPETMESVYFIPRPNGDVILGGTFQDENWDVR